MTFRIDARHLTAVAAVLKERFPNLTTVETIRITTKVLDAVKAVEAEKGNAGPDGDVGIDNTLFGLVRRIRNDVQLTIAEVQAVNVERANRWHGGDFRSWSGLEWAGAMCGEAGEAANVAKKLKRTESDIAGNAWSDRPLDKSQLVDALAKEASDTFLYLTLLCSRYGINLASAVQQTFNSKSEELGYPERL